MINFMNVKAKVAAVKQMVESGYNICEIYARYSRMLDEASIEDEEEYEALQEIDVYLRQTIVEVYMDQNGYRKDERGRYGKE